MLTIVIVELINIATVILILLPRSTIFMYSITRYSGKISRVYHLGCHLTPQQGRSMVYHYRMILIPFIYQSTCTWMKTNGSPVKRSLALKYCQLFHPLLPFKEWMDSISLILRLLEMKTLGRISVARNSLYILFNVQVVFLQFKLMSISIVMSSVQVLQKGYRLYYQSVNY